MKKILTLFLVTSLLLSFCSCSIVTMENKPNENPIDKSFDPIDTSNTFPVENDFPIAISQENAVSDMAFDLLHLLHNGDENILISPLSVSMALGITASGCDNDSKIQFENFLGRGFTLDKMNEFYQSYIEKIDNTEENEVDIANSLWIRGNSSAINVNEDFLNKAEEIFDAEVFTSPFDKTTVDAINNWVNDKTDSMIKEIIDEIGKDAVMYIINALAFDAEWESPYTNTRDNFRFVNANGEGEYVTVMHSKENYYLEGENCTGFIKDYKGGEYSFVVLLPNFDTNISDFVNELNGDTFRTILSNAQNITVKTSLPKFTFEYTTSLVKPLKQLGVSDPFSPQKADFSKLGVSEWGNLYISEVLHKTFIEVAEKGTRAAAVTSVEIEAESTYIEDMKEVIVNRPFVFAIVDNTSKLPVFLGITLTTK
ncbi:MAG: DUF2961 domain-containing protein [Ruminococcaceae bacterium]|nr:DUF2961 domain-containing protein [Oscillospiraceae bacterium]